MDQLKLLWDLETNSKEIIKEKKLVDKLSSDDVLFNIEEELKLINLDLLEKSNNLDQLKERTFKMESIIKGLDFELKSIDKDLYDGSITDLKQLEALSEKKLSLKDDIDQAEIGLLIIYEDIENLKNQISTDKELEEVEKEKYLIYKKDLISKIEVAKEKIEVLRKENKKIKELVNEDILNEYLKILETKKVAIARVEKDVCKGCNMVLSSGFLDEVKKQKKLYKCENCGRILYYIEENK